MAGAGTAPIAVAGAGQEGEQEALKDDVYTGAVYGDLEELHRLVEREGRSVTEPDGLGHYALQWAALNNRVATAQYILEHGADVNATDHTGQTALHWSAVRGHIQVAELLLKEGAKVDAADLYGYQVPLSVCEWFKDYQPTAPGKQEVEHAYEFVKKKFEELYFQSSKSDRVDRVFKIYRTTALDQKLVKKTFKLID